MGVSILSRWNPWRGVGGLPRDVWILSGSLLVNRMGTMVLPFLVLYLTSDLGFAPGRAGLVLSLYGVGSLVASPLAGRLCDRFGPVRVLMVSLGVTAVLFALFPLAREFWTVVLATVVLSLAAESFRPAAFAAFAERSAPGQRKAAFALARLAVNLGMSVGPAVGGFLATVSFHAIFWVDGGTCLLALFVLLSWPLSSRGGSGEGGTADGAPAPARSTAALGDSRMRRFLIATVLAAAVFFQLQGAIPLYLVRNLGLAESTYGLMFTVNTVLIVIVEVRLNLATAHWPHRRTMALGAALLGAGFGAMAFCTTAWAVLATVVVWTVGEMILLPGMAAYVADIAPEDRRGEYMGLYTMAFGLAFTFAPWLGTEVLERAGAGSLFAGMLAVSLMAGAVYLRLPADARSVAAASAP